MYHAAAAAAANENAVAAAVAAAAVQNFVVLRADKAAGQLRRTIPTLLSLTLFSCVSTFLDASTEKGGSVRQSVRMSRFSNASVKNARNREFCVHKSEANLISATLQVFLTHLEFL